MWTSLKRVFLFIFLPVLVFSLVSPISAVAKGSNEHGNSAYAHQKQKHKNQSYSKQPKNKQNQPSRQNFKKQTPPKNAIHYQTKPPTVQKVKAPNPKTISNSNKSTQIHLHLNKCYKSASKVFVQWNGKWMQMINQGNSPLYKLKDGGQYVKDDITAFKVVTEKKELIFPVKEIKVGVEAQGTINYWLNKCEQTNDQNKQIPIPPVKKDENKASPSPAPKKEENKLSTVKDNTVVKEIENKTTDHPEKVKVVSSGVLPKTGESSPIGYYLAGILLLALGIYFWKSAKARNG